MVYFLKLRNYNFVVVQSQSHVWCFVTPWTSVCQASRSFTISQSLLKNYSLNHLFSSDFTSFFISILFCSMTKSTMSYLSFMSPWSVLICDSFSVFLVFHGLILWRLLVPYFIVQFSSVVQARLPCPSLIPRVYENLYPLSWWCHPTISFSVIPFSSCLQSFPASESFLVSQFFTSGDQSIGVSASASVLPMNIPDWFPLA